LNVQPELQSTGRQAVYISPIPHAISCLSSICEATFWERVGKDRNGNGTGEFVSPTEIAVNDHEVVVLDAARSRIQILDSDGKRTGFYRVVASDHGDGGLAVDNDGNIYISYVASSIISMYQPDGTPLGTFGQPGSRIGEFRAPRGLWVDGNNRIYVSDTGNARVQVFQVSVTEPSSR
jgi:hypothetical protein